jgi:hypothetical protein
MSEIIDKIRARLEACPIPEGAVADWKDTRHFEIQQIIQPGTGEFWWLEASSWELAMRPDIDGSDECQERCGAVLDYAVAYRPDVQALLAAIETAWNDAYRECAERICCYCAVHTRAGFTFQDVGDGILQHVFREGTTHNCKAIRLRQARPKAFEKP